MTASTVDHCALFSVGKKTLITVDSEQSNYEKISEVIKKQDYVNFVINQITVVTFYNSYWLVAHASLRNHSSKKRDDAVTLRDTDATIAHTLSWTKVGVTMPFLLL